MPEGDTIYRAAKTLQEALAGQKVTKFETALAQLASVDDQQPIEGRVIERVVSAGKHLIMTFSGTDFSGGLHLRTHMRMNGSWHIYRPGERWKRPRRRMRIVIATEPWVAVGFDIPVAEFLDDPGLVRQSDLRKIGPDLLDESFDAVEAFRRIRERADSEIANVILNQRVIAGIGNVFKSETLFLCGAHPFAKVQELSDETIEKLIETNRRLLRYNVEENRAGRETTGSMDRQQKLWVYSRGGEPCRRCTAPIEYAKQGLDARGTYWCPRCQPRPEAQ